MTIEEIVEELRANNLMIRDWQTTVEFIADCADNEGLTDEDPVTIGIWPRDADGEKKFRGLIRYTVGDFRALKEEIVQPQPHSSEEQ